MATVDAVCALAAGIIGFDVRFGGHSWLPWKYLAFALAMPLVWLPWLVASSAYDGRFFGAGSDEYRHVLHAGVSLTATVAIVSYATKAEVARGFVLVTLPLMTALSLYSRWRFRKKLHRARAEGACMRRVVAVGHPGTAADLVRELGRSTHHGMQVVAACTPGRVEVPGLHGSLVPVLGDLQEVPEVVAMTKADTIAVLACPELDALVLRRLAWELEKTHTEIFVAPALLEVAGPRTTIRPIAGLPLLHVDHPELAGPRRFFKRCFDVVMASAALLVLGPLMLLMVAVIRLSDGGPALFVQTRIGRNGEEFPILKFRTMVQNAHTMRTQLPGAEGLLFKLKDDPRLTRVGGLLRRYSIDELPQLFNVLRGDMSLVGPRPPLPEEVERYGQDVRRRLVVKPGLTGLWQVSGRSDLEWEESVRLDLHYVENWSLVLDMQILWKTIAVVTSGSGAY